MAAIASYSPTTNISLNGLNSFTLDLYQQCINSTNENVIFSPLSILNALTLLSQATSGNTFEELKRGLYLNDDKTVAANQFHEYNGLIRKNIGKGNLSIANRIYVKSGYSLNKHFEEVAITKFSSGIQSVNFTDKIETAQKINQFVEENTNGKIKDIIKPDVLSSDTAVMLINAIHFKAEWQYPFDERLTTESDFFISDTKKMFTEFMSVTDNFRRIYLNDLDATALEMKYANSKFAFMIILPGTRTGLFPLEGLLKNYDLRRIGDNLWQPVEMNVIIPKFKIEFEINLNDALKNMNMGEMFDQSKANLDGILDPSEHLYVSDVIHKAFIDVNEQGTEAAGATSVLIDFRSGVDDVETLPIFRADHPFLYYIWDTESKTVIFTGRITKF